MFKSFIKFPKRAFEPTKASYANDPYFLLNVPRNVDLKTVKKQYFKLAKQYHPDLNPGDMHAQKMFLAIQSAYK